MMVIVSGICFSVPTQISYQGVLKDSSGNAVTNHSLSMVFSIYSAASGGSALWTETQTVSVEAGIYSIQLGSATAISSSVFDGTTRYLGIKVGTDSEMTPRLALNSVPYAYRANTADSIASGTAVTSLAKQGDTRLTGAVDVKAGSNVTVTQTGQTLEVASSGSGDIVDHSVTGSKLATDIIISTTGTLSAGAAQVSGSSYALSAESSGSTAKTIYAISHDTSGTNYALYAINNSPSGYGICGYNQAGSGGFGVLGGGNANDITGVKGQSATGKGVYGTSSSGQGVYGEATAGGIGVYGYNADNIGVYGKGNACGVSAEATASVGKGVCGLASSATGTTYGGYFAANSTAGTAVFGLASGTGACSNVGGSFEARGDSGIGVYGNGTFGVSGVSSHGGGTGVSGSSSGNIGVYGATTASSGKGVYGYADVDSSNASAIYGSTAISSSSYSGYFYGGKGVYIINGDLTLVNPDTVPATASSTGTTGMISWDSNYIYICVDTNTWKRVAIATW